jgi:methionyl aminopeptidase
MHWILTMHPHYTRLLQRWDTRVMTITYKDAAGIEGMRVAGKLASEVLDYLTPFIKPGLTTNDIDRLAHDYMTQVQQTIPATLGYQPAGYAAYPKSLCTSVNHQVCHGIPNDKPLKKGDIGDTSRMYLVGDCSIAAKRLCSITFEAMWQGIMRVKPGVRLGDIGFAIQQFAERQGFSIVREFCGHGIGLRFHEDPQVLHYGKPGTLEALKPGMIFTIEPMINAGKRDIKDGPEKDGWSIVTRDHSLSAQWEHTVLVTETGYEVLTLSAGSPQIPHFVSDFVSQISAQETVAA